MEEGWGRSFKNLCIVMATSPPLSRSLRLLSCLKTSGRGCRSYLDHSMKSIVEFKNYFAEIVLSKK